MSLPKSSLCIFGASGFTGKKVALEVATQIQAFHRGITPFTWSIAGRSRRSLEKLQDEIKEIVGASSASGSDQTNIDKGLLPSLVEANVNDINSLRSMARGTKLVLNCVGPYAHLGENVVVAVLEASEASDSGATHYIDLSGEPNFIERMVLEYRARAKAVGCAIIPASAFDSVPADMGTIFAKSLLEPGAVPASVEMVFELKTESTVAGHYATYASAVHGFSPPGRKSLSVTRRQLYSSLPKVAPLAKGKGLSLGFPKRKKTQAPTFLCVDADQNRTLVDADFFHRPLLQPFFFADPAVVRLSQALIAEEEGTNFRPIQFAAWISIPSLRVLFLLALYFSVFSLLSKYSTGRKLLLRHPKVFTMGVFSHEGPTLQQLEDTTFVTTLTARGHSQKSFEAASVKEPDVKTVIKIRGPEPGYIATPILFVAVALTILQEEGQVHKGVSVPGAALRDTSLIKRLNKDGRVTFNKVA
ncbi:hypothetical protein CBS101457_003775 [Exobasidium rhododendri]|nr:hypothetical protein CBS101457_003775 [Exobasidium rhododendri]